MKEETTSAQLCLDGPGGFTYVVALVRYIVREDETFRYELLPNYEVIDLLGPEDYQGIPGFDLSHERRRYVRENRTPTLIADRAPMENREDLWELLAAYGMEYFDPLEWLVRSKKRYIGDKFYFRRAEDAQIANREPLDIEFAVEGAPSTLQGMKRILSALCAGDPLKCAGESIDRSGRKMLYRVLLVAYEKMRRSMGRSEEAKDRSPLGRKRKPIDELMLREAIERYRAGKITAKEAACSLGIGEATFYRRMAER